MNDSAKLRTLAIWFDVDDAKKGNTGHEVQDDLRRIADTIESLQRRVAELEGVIRWANGEGGEWPERKPGAGVFYWRKELMRRAVLKARST